MVVVIHKWLEIKKKNVVLFLYLNSFYVKVDIVSKYLALIPKNSPIRG